MALYKTIKLTGTSRLYYTGNWAKDIYDNYTEKQTETIFKKVEKLKPHLTFFQSKLESFKDEDGKIWEVMIIMPKNIIAQTIR